MSNNTQQSLAKLKRLVRYLKRVGDDKFRLLLGCQKTREVITFWCRTDRQPQAAIIHTQTEDYRKKQSRG